MSGGALGCEEVADVGTQDEQNEKANKLLRGEGSVAQKTQWAKELDDEHLQMIAPHSKYAKEELERRRAERALQAQNRWYTRPIGIVALGIVASLIAAVIYAAYFGAGYDPGPGRFVETERKRNDEDERLAKEAKEREARLEAQRQSKTERRRAEAERQPPSAGTGAGAGQSASLQAVQAIENDFRFEVKSCRRSGQNLICSGSITNLFKGARQLGLGAKLIDNEGEEYKVEVIQIGNRRIPGWWSNSYVDVEPNLSINMIYGATGGSSTAGSVSLVLEYGAQLGWGNVWQPGRVEVSKVILRNIPVTNQ